MTSLPNGHSSSPVGDEPDSFLDVLIVGGGFGGLYQLHQYRKLGYSVQIFEAAPNLGGVWYWNCYPGARVDSDVPNYEFSSPELWKDWVWTEKFPDWRELRRYFDHVDEKWDVRKDIRFSTRVKGTRWEEERREWVIEAEDSSNVDSTNGTPALVRVRARFLSLCVGFAAKPYIPPLKGLESFQGICHHTSRWPQSGVDFRGKRVGVVGTGASGVQVIQEIAREVEHLTVFQRTPNMAIPMRQAKLDKEEQTKKKGLYPTIYRRRRQTYTGYFYDRYPKSALEVTPEERLLYLEDVWQQGGFHFVTSNFNDLRTNQETNDQIYAFWRDKVRERLIDPVMQEKLAPTIPPHPFGIKRPCLEQRYYEVFNQSNVTLLVAEENPIDEVTPKGIRTADGIEHEFDVIVLATGFDALTGGITQIDIKGVGGLTMEKKWKPGVYTYLGMTSMGFPNMFFTYSAQAPTAFGNGPTILEMQGDWVVNCIKYMKDNKFSRIEPKSEFEQEWRKRVHELSAKGLWSKAKSWYMGANIPGKVVEPLNWAGGSQNYERVCVEVAEKGYEGFVIA